jgi:pimeloyl-ACP methyl ester carboxylesterase
MQAVCCAKDAELLAGLGLGGIPLLLLGAGAGGQAALHFAATYPRRMAAVVLLDAPPLVPPVCDASATDAPPLTRRH